MVLAIADSCPQRTMSPELLSIRATRRERIASARRGGVLFSHGIANNRDNDSQNDAKSDCQRHDLK